MVSVKTGPSDELRLDGGTATPLVAVARARVSPTMTAAALGLATAVCAVIVASSWRGADWPAQLYRVEFFRTHGWASFDTGWYGGHYPLAYSVLFPVLASFVGPAAVVAVSIAGATWAFDSLVYEQFGPRGRVGTLCFAAGALLNVSIGQLPFLLGAQFALLALVALHRHRTWLAFLAAVVTPLASPVAAVFAVLAASRLGLHQSRTAQGGAAGRGGRLRTAGRHGPALAPDRPLPLHGRPVPARARGLRRHLSRSTPIAPCGRARSSTPWPRRPPS